MEIAVELSQIVINENVDQQIIVLRELGGAERSFPIVIGMPEAVGIDRRLKAIGVRRPWTHDLLSNMITSLGGNVEKVVINDIDAHTYFAKICVRQGADLVEVDSRPSDAIALAAGLDVPLFVEEHVFGA